MQSSFSSLSTAFSSNAPYVFIGSAIRNPKEESEKQQAQQNKIPKRFHGAFTGGFTAGYHNTVGSKEGHTQTYIIISLSRHLF
jgi:G patch domain-containing protein 1